jgi:DNA-binding MarR family transcriptional regulator
VLDTLATGASPPERSRLVPALAAALAARPARVEAVLDDAEAAGLVRVVSAPGGDIDGVRVELTNAGEAQHTTLRSAVDRAAAELCAGIPDHDLAAAHRVLEEVTRRADGWMQFWAAARTVEVAR